MIYMPIYGNGYANVTIVQYSTRNVDALALPIEKAVGLLDPDLLVSDVATRKEILSKSTLGSQFNSLLVLGFAVIALVLAAVRHYGVVGYLVTQRTGEIGIRIALGAQRTASCEKSFSMACVQHLSAWLRAWPPPQSWPA